jgi:type I restriction enzyme S subunit
MKTQLDSIEQEYRKTDVSSLPHEWTLKKICDAFEISRKPKQLKISLDDEIVFISMENISDSNKTCHYKLKKYSNISSGIFVQKGDLIVAKITPCFENGKQAVLNNIPRDFAVATTEVIPIHSKDNEEALIQYLQYYLKLPDVRKELESKMEGTTGRKRLPKSVLSNTSIALPPVLEQKKIISVLSTIQVAQEKSENVISSLKELKKSLMKHLFTYGAINLEDTESISLKDTEIGKLNETWEVVRLDQMAEITMGQSPKGETYNTVGNGVPLINGPTEYGPRNPRIVQWTTTPTKLCQKGDILFCVRGNTLGRLNISDAVFCIGRGIAAIRGIDNISDTTFLYYFLEMKAAEIYGKCVGVNSTFPNISGASMKKIKVSKPPLPIQKHIAQIVGTVDAKIESEQRKKKALGELFQSMLLNLMTAKIRVNDLEV